MAIKLTTLAFETPYKPTPKVILLTLCDNANDQGECYPSLKTLSIKSSVGTSNLNYVLNTLEAIQLINREPRKRKNGSNTSTLYRINLSKLVTVAHSNGENRKSYLFEYEAVYKKIIAPKGKKKKNQILDKGSNQNLDKGKNQILDKLVQPIGQLYEPSVNHQEISKDISSSKKRRESFVDFKERIINLYSGYPILKGPKINNDLRFIDEVVISISIEYLHNDYTNKDLDPEDAKKIWKWMFLNQEKLLPIKKEETA